MNHLHFTKEFERKILDDSKREIIYKKLEDLRLIDKLETLKTIDTYPKGISVLKFFGSNTCRVILEHRTISVEESTFHVLFVRDYISKKGFDYFWGANIHPLLVSGDWKINYPLPEDEITAFSNTISKAISTDDFNRPKLPETLTGWLNNFTIKLNFDIYEREAWVKYSNDRSLFGLQEKHILIFKEIIKSVIQEYQAQTIAVSAVNNESSIFKAINQVFNLGIIYADFQDIDGRRILLLYDGADLSNPDQLSRWNSVIATLSEPKNTVQSDLLSITRDAFRAYPKWIILNDTDDLWNAIQRYDGTHNLSLLPEQVSFLNNFKFPAYINGQAGSGKSTMLYYLFSNVLLSKFLGEIGGNIIFLTENDNLLEHTQKSIIGLLSRNPEFNVGLSLEQINSSRQFFSSFRSYLLALLPQDQQKNYQADKYLDFAKFKELYRNNYSQKKFSAEEIWFVLTTYVYGYYEDQIIDSVEKYINDKQGIPAKFRIVDPEIFREILTASLTFYKKLIQTDGWWDKTTLVREIWNIYGNNLPKRYSVVFCDEAQDFSRIELRLILRSCEYIKYNLEQTDQIPIVFAGDALQTVSPTGFSDTRLHQMYYDIFQDANFHYDKSRATYNPEFNYRSVKPIVRLANIVQNFRKEALKEEIYIRQEAKRVDSSFSLPVLHYKEWLLRPENINDFINKFRYKSFIVPVDLNEEDDYVSREELLKSFTDIKSSIDAKGAEYSEVVVYGFGEYFLNEFKQLSWTDTNSGFKKRFFFNKLYVAITRAQNELVIVDSEIAAREFWQPLLDIPINITDKWETYSNINEVLPISPETGLQHIRTSSPDDALSNANIDFEQGVYDRNIARLIVASNVYLLLGKVEEAFSCLAHKELILKNWVIAGDNFKKAHKYDDAANCYFKAKQWEKLRSITAVPNLKQEVRVLIGRLLEFSLWSDIELNKISELRRFLPELLNGVDWYDEFIEQAIAFASAANKADEKRKLILVLEEIATDKDDSSLWPIIGLLYFETRQFACAVEAWDRSLALNEHSKYFGSYIRACIEKARDEKAIIDEALWIGRLLKQHLDENEKLRLAKQLLNYYFSNTDDFVSGELRQELLSNTLYAAVLSQETISISNLVEQLEQTVSKEALASYYPNYIAASLVEETAILLKERYAKALNDKYKQLGYRNTVELINNDFSKHNFPFPNSNVPWTIEEINKIPDKPQAVALDPTPHFFNITVENFRQFKRLELQNLGLYNLILGNNNSGKTSVLEALLFSPNIDECLLNFVYSNKQRNCFARKEKDYSFLDNLIYKDAKEKQLLYTVKDGRRYRSYRLRNPTVVELTQHFHSDEFDPRHYLALDVAKKPLLFSKRIEFAAKDLEDPNYLKNVSLIPFGKGYSENLSSIYHSEIGSKRALRIEFEQQMRIFIPNIVGITIDPELDIIEIEESIGGQDFKAPLHDYGEGANKLFRILIQLHAAKDRRLMIDEIDAGIHYSRFPEFWKIILKTAKEYNVQVFATTHNEECISFFTQVLQDSDFTSFREASRIVTLERHIATNEIVPIVRDFDSIEYAFEQQLEIRGRKL